MNDQQIKKHIDYLDELRALAVFAVVVLHVSAQNWYSADVFSSEWAIFNIYDSAVRWAVPVFVMISGALFLNKNINIKTIFTKYIFRLAVAYAFWSVVYAVINGGSIKTILANTISGHFHMWYIPMLIGLYVSIPIYQQIAKNQHIVKYFLIIAGIITVVVPYIMRIIKDFCPGVMISLVSLLEPHLKDITSSMMLGFSLYFLLGYYLNKTDFSKKQRLIIYVVGCLGFFMTAFTTYLVSHRALSARVDYYSEFAFGTLAQAVAVFVFCKYNSLKQNKICALLSKTSFGIYWVHMLVVDMLDKNMVNTLSFSPYLSVPVISIVVFTISFIISWLISMIPLLKRYIV